MKKVIIGIAIVVCFTMGITLGGSGKHPSSDSMPRMTVEKAFAADVTPNTITLDRQTAQDASIFSWTTILYLSGTVIGIVAFRRKTYA